MQIKHILTKAQREAGLITDEEFGNRLLTIYDTTRKLVGQSGLYVVTTFMQSTTIREIQKAADEYLRGRK
jgi:hypothetical protein